MKRKQFKLSEAETKRIKQAVVEAESKTSGEIVPFLVAQSDDYLWVVGFWAGLGWLAASLGVWNSYRHSDWNFSFVYTLFWQCSGILLGIVLSFLPPFKRLIISKALRARNVHREVLASFVGAGLSETKHRTGVLLYLSALERRVEILADRGINEKTPKGYWQEHVDAIVKGIHAGSPTDVICEVIKKIGEELSKNFPRQADDVNELSDEVHLTPAD